MTNEENLIEEIQKAKNLLMRWCNDALSLDDIHKLEKETILFCANIENKVKVLK